MPAYKYLWLVAWDLKTELILSFLVLLLIRVLMWKLSKQRPNIPGPFPWPVIGNAISLGSKPHQYMQAMAKKYGPIFLMKLGSADVLVLNNYDSIKEALGRQKHIFEGRPQFDSFANISQGKGIVFNSSQTMGKNWQNLKTTVIKHLHRFVTKPHTRTLLANHVMKESICLIDILDCVCHSSPSGSVEPEPMINASVANIVCAFVFGHRYDYKHQEFCDLISLNRQFGEVVNAGSQVDVLPWIKVFPPFKRILRTFNFLTNRLNLWMLLRTREHKSQYIHGKTRDLLDLFIAEGIEKPSGLLNDETIMALTTDVFGAAQDTLSTTVQWIFIYMMYFPEVQEKVQHEIDSFLGDEDLPNIVDTIDFPFTMAVLHEICRHCSFTATTIPHCTTADTFIGNYCVPRGMLVFVNQYAANHDSAYWENPDDFIPERFLDQRGLLMPNVQHKYLLFSYGSRKCPGDEITWAILSQMMITLLNLCEVESDPAKPASLEAVFNLSSRPKSLNTRLRIRKPTLMQRVKQNSSRLSPHIPTVDSHQSSFLSSSLSKGQSTNNGVYEPKNGVHIEQNHNATLEFSDDEELKKSHDDFNKKTKPASKTFSFLKGLRKNKSSNLHSQTLT